MPISLSVLCSQIDPAKTTLLLGAGSTIPSGGLSGPALALYLAKEFETLQVNGYTLMETTSLIEKGTSRKVLVRSLQKKISPIKASGAILTIPDFPWRALYTTNYDTVLEQAYAAVGADLAVYSSNFDFTVHEDAVSSKLFKFHGTIERDKSIDGGPSSLIVTERDYDSAREYREMIYKTLSIDMNLGPLLVIGNTLAEPDLKDILQEAIKLKRDSGGNGRIVLLLYTKDEQRASLFEEKGIDVVFGSLDDFVVEMLKSFKPGAPIRSDAAGLLNGAEVLHVEAIDIRHAMEGFPTNVHRMFNGSPASYSDVLAGLCFQRDATGKIQTAIEDVDTIAALILGASGVGKTTLARMAMVALVGQNRNCWEHKSEFSVHPDEWLKVEANLRKANELGVLFIDDAHLHLREVNMLITGLAKTGSPHLKLVLTSTKHKWNPRIKASYLFSQTKQFEISRLSQNEIGNLIALFEHKKEISDLVETKFHGYGVPERRRRLTERCGADMFVCLKNIFSSDSLDDIILREYADLDDAPREVFRTVSAMEASGVQLHRQIIIRTLGIPADNIAGVLAGLDEIVTEHTIDQKEGIYRWQGRHPVISEIILSYKFSDEDEYAALIERIIENLVVTKNIEVRSLREMCDMTSGIGRIKDVEKQNYLFRRMITLAPSERVPRHRLIRNLINESKFPEATSEIRIFERDLGSDAPITRYKALLQLRRAQNAKSILKEDRLTILQDALKLAKDGVRKYDDDKGQHEVHLDIGLEILRLSGDWKPFDDALDIAKVAEQRSLDPDIGRIVGRFETLAIRVQSGR